MASIPSIIDTVRDQPVRLVAAVEATLIALVAFGVPITKDQIVAIVGALALWLAVVTPSQVSPMRRVVVHQSDLRPGEAAVIVNQVDVEELDETG